MTMGGLTLPADPAHAPHPRLFRGGHAMALLTDGLAWTMAVIEKADRLLVRARRAVSAKWKVAAASVMAASAVVCAKIKARMAAQSDGNLDARANASQFAGGWGTLVGGVNGLVDAIVVPS